MTNIYPLPNNKEFKLNPLAAKKKNGGYMKEEMNREKHTNIERVNHGIKITFCGLLTLTQPRFKEDRRAWNLKPP